MSAARSQKGFVLIVTCIVLAILIALAALGIDVGRMYVIKSELQAFADAAALNAAIQMDGTDQGLERAAMIRSVAGSVSFAVLDVAIAVLLMSSSSL